VVVRRRKMENPGNLFDAMVKEAMEEVGNHGWKRASVQAVTLAAFGMLGEKIDRRINRLVKPAWVIACSVAGAAIWFIISKLMGVN